MRYRLRTQLIVLAEGYEIGLQKVLTLLHATHD